MSLNTREAEARILQTTIENIKGFISNSPLIWSDSMQKLDRTDELATSPNRGATALEIMEAGILAINTEEVISRAVSRWRYFEHPRKAF